MYGPGHWQQNARSRRQLRERLRVESDGEFRAAVVGSLFVQHGA
jgi:hypothetical protein